MYPGRTQQQKDDFAKTITKSAVEILKVAKEQDVIVVFKENPKGKLVFSRRTAVTFFHLFLAYLFILI